MPVELRMREEKLDAPGRIIEITMTGKLEVSDYEKFVPVITDAIKAHGKIRILAYLHDFHGWSLSAMWEDIKFDYEHYNDIERLAIVGESQWEAGMAAFCKPFTGAKIRYFHHDRLPEARQWIEEA